MTYLLGNFRDANDHSFLLTAWLRWRTRQPPDRVRNLYDRFCQKAAQLGAQREPCEGPADFARRAARLIPGESDQNSPNFQSLHSASLCAAIAGPTDRQICQERELIR